MDYLVKKNIIKKNKIIVDIGQKFVKILAVNYEKGRITIQGSHKVDVSACFFEVELSDVRELVKKIYTALSRRKLSKHTEISLSLPSYMVTHRIVSVKNVKPKDLNKHIKKEYPTLGKANSVTHYIDWAYLGAREENGETVHYCMLAAVSKAYMTPLLREFEKKNLNVTNISFPTYNLVSLSDLYVSDYENSNKLLLDFGMDGSRVVVECDGVAVYSRDIDIGFNTFVDGLFNSFSSVGIPEIVSMLINMGDRKENFFAGMHNMDAFYAVIDKLIGDFQNELVRIIQMCDEDGFSISKIICCSGIIDGILALFEENGITIDYYNFHTTDNQSGSTYTIISSHPADEIDATFGGAIGLAVSTLQ